MPGKGDSAQDEPNESERREHSVGVGHLEGVSAWCPKGLETAG